MNQPGKYFRPPKIAELLLNRILPDESWETPLGDFEEYYNLLANKQGVGSAWCWYWGQVFKLMPEKIFNSIFWSITMFRNYLKTAVRNISKQKAFSLINIAGLSTGMTCCILLLFYINFELSYDKYHKNSGRIYRVAANFTNGGITSILPCTPPPAGPALKRDFPEVINAVRFLPMPKSSVNYKDKSFYEEKIFFADNSVFDIFTFPIISGSSKNTLLTEFTAVITRETAEKYFGEENPVGKVMKINDRDSYTITGVIENLPENSHFTFDILCSFSTLNVQRGDQIENWSSALDYYTYILLQEKAAPNVLEQKFPVFMDTHMGSTLKSWSATMELFLQPLTSIHLHSNLEYEISGNSDIAYIFIFSVIAFFILLIACINFMNLATARSASRAREVGVRKVLGADRNKLIKQFLGESLIFSFISLAIALILVRLALPVLNSVSGSDFFPGTNFFSGMNSTSGFSGMQWLIPGFFVLAVVVGLFAGSYPAFFLSAFQPVKTLQGSFKAGSGNAVFRNVLVFFQFFVSISLIISTGIIVKQLDYMKNRKLGFDKEHVVVLPFSDINVRRSIKTLKNELKNYNRISGVAASFNVPGERPGAFYYLPEGFAKNQSQIMETLNVDNDFIPSMGIELAAGRNFSHEFPADQRNSVIINETAAGRFGWTIVSGSEKNQITDYSPAVGKTISDGRSKKTVIGVLKDFHLTSLHKEIMPLYISSYRNYFNSISIRIKPGNISGTLNFIRGELKKIAPNSPFDYHFLDESFDRQYKADDKLSQIFKYFSTLAIFLACLGLLGMASFMAEQRTKEIGIRKVLGASTSGIVKMFGEQMIKLLVVANAAAWPLVYFLSTKWLEGFAYHMQAGLTSYILPAIMVFMLAIATISFQSIKAATANPIDSLRNE